MFLFSTDNGFIVRRNSGIDTIVYTTGAGTWEEDDLYSLLVHNKDIYCTNYHIHATPNRYPVLSSDSGATWVAHTANSARNYAEQTVHAIDTQGNLYNYSNMLTANYNIYKSTDHGLTWTSIYDVGAIDVQSLRVSNGYLWYRLKFTDTSLHRLNLDGTGHTSFSTSFPDIHHGMTTRHDVNMLYLAPFNTSSGRVFSVDTSIPTTPVFVQSSSATPFGSEYPIWIEPLSASVAIAYTATFVAPPADVGSIWRTTDAGATWTRVLGPTDHLHVENLPSPGGTSLAPMSTNNIASKTALAYVGGMVPYIYKSVDEGITWIADDCTVNVSPDALFHNWDSMTLSGRVRVPVSTVVGAT